MKAESVKKRQRLLKQLREMGPVLKGSLAEVELTCGTPGCRCHGSGPKHKAYYFSYRARGKTQTVYVPKGKVLEAQKANANWLKLKEILEQLTVLEIETLREKKGRGKRGRKE